MDLVHDLFEVVEAEGVDQELGVGLYHRRVGGDGVDDVEGELHEPLPAAPGLHERRGHHVPLPDVPRRRVDSDAEEAVLLTADLHVPVDESRA
jgi:hypothetical protein